MVSFYSEGIYVETKGQITYSFDPTNKNDKKILKAINDLISNMQPMCINCKYFYREGGFGGYMAGTCNKHGDLEWVGHPHYDGDGSKCADYERNKEIKK